MSNSTGDININVLTEIKEALKELEYMEKHPEKYKSYNNIDDLKKALLSND